MEQNVSVHKDDAHPENNNIDPFSIPLSFKKSTNTKDSVSWTIDKKLLNDDYLSIKSTNSSIVPTTNGKPNVSTLALTPNYRDTGADTKDTVSYKIYINFGKSKAAPIEVAGGELVIDTIGNMGPHPEGGKGGHKHRRKH